MRFFLSSLKADSKNFARAVRGHWSVENTVHWSLDVCFAEDTCRIRVGYAAENMAILGHITLNVLKNDTSKKRGIKGKQKNAAWDHSYLLSLPCSPAYQAGRWKDAIARLRRFPVGNVHTREILSSSLGRWASNRSISSLRNCSVIVPSQKNKWMSNRCAAIAQARSNILACHKHIFSPLW